MSDKQKKSEFPLKIDANIFSAALFLAARGEYEAAGKLLASIVDQILQPYKKHIDKRSKGDV